MQPHLYKLVLRDFLTIFLLGTLKTVNSVSFHTFMLLGQVYILFTGGDFVHSTEDVHNTIQR